MPNWKTDSLRYTPKHTDYVEEENQRCPSLGLVPLSSWTNKPPITQSLIKDTAKVLAEAGFALWTNRIEAVKKWETTVGICPHKEGPHPPPARPGTRDQPPAKRGRPSKLDEDRSQPYRDLLARRKRVQVVDK